MTIEDVGIIFELKANSMVLFVSDQKIGLARWGRNVGLMAQLFLKSSKNDLRPIL
jgi:hypothetical protein